MRLLVLTLGAIGLLVGCATAARSARSSPVDAVAPPAAAFTAEPMTPVPQARPAARRPTSYATLKGGAIYPSDDDLDSGYFFGGAFGNYVNPFLAFEFESGYGHCDLDQSGSDLSTIPMLLNARVTLPVWILDLYGGGGLGSTYYDLETNAFDVEGWLLAADVFVGAEFVVRERTTVGLELKYYFTEEIERTDDRLDSLALLATFGWRF